MADVEVAILVFMPMWSYFGYTPDFRFLPMIGAKQLLLEAVNHPNTWIFYYIGHGDSDFLRGDGLLPGMNCDDISNCKPEFVNSSEIHADSKIVFLNSCNSASDNKKTLVAAFGVDGLHNGSERPEAFLGWTDVVEGHLAGIIGIEFWMLMGKPLKPYTSVTSAMDFMGRSDYLYSEMYKLYKFDPKGTTLVP
jgi:hypothetical protein